MRWSIQYRIRLQRAWTDDDQRVFDAHAAKWAKQLSEASEPLRVVRREPNELVGSSTPGPTDSADDYVVIVRALREIETLFPGSDVVVFDDEYLVEPTHVDEISLEDLRQYVADAWEEPDEDRPAELADAEADSQDVQLFEQMHAKLESAKADFAIWKRAQLKK
jgi:hypothetical protein